MEPHRDFCVGSWLVQPRLGRLSRGATTHHLRPRLMELLVFLAGHAGDVVSKDEILERVWQRKFVSESVLTRSVADLRHLLGDDPASRFIETIPKRGYRLIAPVSQALPEHVVPAAHSIAVLPFLDMAPGHQQEYFCDGLAEELTNALAQLPGCRVVARASAFAFKGQSIDVREIGRRLNVSAVLEGSVQRMGDRLRVIVQLIDAGSGCHVWSHRFDCSTTDVFSVEDETVQGVVSALEVRIGSGRSVVQGRTTNPEAHDLYLRGRYLSARRDPEATAHAMECFERAIAADPSYAAAHAALAECHVFTAFASLRPPAEAYPRARAEAERALVLAPDLAEACAVLAHERGMYEWRWQEAEALFRRARELNPGYAPARAWYSHLLAVSGRFEEAIAEAERACEYDPLSPGMQVALALAWYHAGEINRAVERYHRILDVHPTFALAHVHLGRAYIVLGRFDDAVSALSEAVDAFPLAMALLASVSRRLGHRDRATEWIAELERLSRTRYVGAFTWSCAYLWEPEQLTWMTRAFDEHDGAVALMNTDPGPVSAGLHSNPQFLSLLARLGLPRIVPNPGTPDI